VVVTLAPVVLIAVHLSLGMYFATCIDIRYIHA
jgi:hypothetical protein